MKTILLPIFSLVVFFFTSCEKEESIPVTNETESKSIKFVDTLVESGLPVIYDFKVEVDFDRKTGEIFAKLISEMPKYGWDLEYSLNQGTKPVSNHTYKRIKKNEVRFKVMAFPEIKDDKEYNLEIISNSYGSKSKNVKNRLLISFKNN